MLTVAEALAKVFASVRPNEPASTALDAALGLTLAEDIASDVDSPPHDKAMMDGYAIVSSDMAAGCCDLDVIEEVAAGAVPEQTVSSGQATRIMTGAPLPKGADAVVMLERATMTPAGASAAGQPALGRVQLRDPKFRLGQNIMRRGESMRRGDIVLHQGKLIRPIEIGLLAEVGRASVAAIRRPRVAVLSTGDELVPASEIPGPGRIRNSNGPLLVASVIRAGGVAEDLGIARDDRQQLRDKMQQGLEADVLVISGGVSAGAYDLVPGVLQELGAEQVFHKVQLKPGKPLWFGTGPEREPTAPCLIFALPGNPVSSLVCFELFVRPAVRRLAGEEARAPRLEPARLTAAFQHRGDRPTYHPATSRRDPVQGLIAAPVVWRGSGDLRALVEADSLLAFPAGDYAYSPGDSVQLLAID